MMMIVVCWLLAASEARSNVVVAAMTMIRGTV